MESSRSPSSSNQNESLRTLWHKVSQWESSTARVITHTRQRLPAQDETLTPTYLEALLFFNLSALFLFIVIRFYAFFIIYQTIQTLESTEAPLYSFTNSIWAMSLSVDFLFAFLELATIIWFEHFVPTVAFLALRFLYFAINLKQVIQPEILENSPVRSKLSHIYSLSFSSFQLFFNFLLCYLLSLLVYTKIINRLKGKRSNHTVMPKPWQPFRSPKRNFLNYTLIVTFTIFFIIRWRIFGFLELPSWKMPRKLSNSPKESFNDAWTSSLVMDFALNLFELLMVPIAGFFHGTIFFTVIRFVHLAVNLKQVISPELPENAWHRQQFSGLYSPFYVYLHLFFNVVLSCLLPIYLFQLYRRPEVQTSKPTHERIKSA